MNKKGFTLIEIIVVIALIAVVGVGSTIAVLKINAQKQQEVLSKNDDNFKKAIEVYLTNHNEVVNNINTNVEGAVISLELLKNEGLISDKLDINYKENYFIVTKALLSNENLTEECSNSLELNVLASWVKENDESKVLYFCPKSAEEAENTTVENITEPKIACDNNVLNKDSLACKVINNAFSEKERLESNGTYESSYDRKNITYSQEQIEDQINNYKNLYSFQDENTVYRDEVMVYGSTLLPDMDSISKSLMSSDVAVPDIYDFEYSVSINDTSKQLYFYGVNDAMKYYYHCGSDIVYSNNIEIVIKNQKNNNSKLVKMLDISEGTNIKYDDMKSKFINNPDEYIGKYFKIAKKEYCNSSNPEYYYIIKILDITKNSENLTYKYRVYSTRYSNTNETVAENFITEEKYEKTLSKTKDEYGTSYYYRGEINDNYVNFNNMCWRIVRVQGDGNVKLILEDHNSLCENNDFDGDAFIGYGDYGGEFLYNSFSNLVPNYNYITRGGDAAGNGGIMRNAMLNWLDEKNISKDYLKSQRTCIGTEFGQQKNKLDLTSLECKDDAGIILSDYYKSKEDYIAPLTLSEYIYAGNYKSYLTKNYNSNNVILSSVAWWTITPSDNGYSYVIYNNKYAQQNSVTRLNDEHILFDGYYRPTIVLKNSVIVDGNGTINNPYKVK